MGLANRARVAVEGTPVQREELMNAVREAAEIVEAGLPFDEGHQYREAAYPIILRELLDYESE